MNQDQRRASGDSEARTRGQLIDATQRLLASGSAESLTSRAIAARAGANLAAITYYFGSKEQLVTESMIAGAREMLAPVVATLRSDVDPIVKMLNAVALLNQMLSERRSDATIYLQTLAAAATNPAIAASVQGLLDETAHLLAEQIESQRDSGQLAPWVAPEPMARLIIAVVHGTFLGAMVAPERTDEAAIAGQFTRLLLATRTTPPSR